MPSPAETLLDRLNLDYTELHRKFEELYWVVNMGDRSMANEMNKAEKARDAFRSEANNLNETKAMIEMSATSPAEKKRLKIWVDFFQLYQAPPELALVGDEIAKLESKIAQTLTTQAEGYINPKTQAFTPASKIKMHMMMATDPNEDIRKACFTALEELSTTVLDDFIKVVGLRNKYAKALGYEDFYAYRLHMNEGMTKDQVFGLFDKIYEETKGALEKIRELEKTMPGLRKPWNFAYMMSGQFTQEEDPYCTFDSALVRWGRSFSALGIDFKGGMLQLDLLDRAGKHNNGFCHYPMVVNFNGGKRNPGAANFTCNVVYGQIGAGAEGMRTLFHEGGHAADRLNSEEMEVCLNTEWPPASIAWAETHSQFLEAMFGSIEWRVRYAKDKNGNSYPFDLFEKKTRKMRMLSPLGLHQIMMTSNFEKRIYETENLTKEKTMEIAKEMHRKYTDRSEDSLSPLAIPHIYHSDSSAYYHAYGLAILGLEQWKKYFYEKYGYIVDNPNVGREMMEIWAPGSSKKFGEFIKIATGYDLSPEAFIENANMNIESFLSQARRRLEIMKPIPEYTKPVRLNANIKIVHGTKTIADNSKSFEDMAEKYSAWLLALQSFSEVVETRRS